MRWAGHSLAVSILSLIVSALSLVVAVIAAVYVSQGN
jgi:hypothetical protein